MIALLNLYEIGKQNKNKQVSAEKTHQHLIDTILANKWDEQLILTVAKIKSFFQLTPVKINKAIESSKLIELDPDDVESAEIKIVGQEAESDNTLSLLDIEIEEEGEEC